WRDGGRGCPMSDIGRCCTGSSTAGWRESPSSTPATARLTAADDRPARCRSLPLRLDRPDRDHQLVVGVAGIELLLLELLRGHPVEEGGGREHVAEGLDRHVLAGEELLQQPPGRERGEPPVVAPDVHLRAADLADARDRG